MNLRWSGCHQQQNSRMSQEQVWLLRQIVGQLLPKWEQLSNVILEMLIKRLHGVKWPINIHKYLFLQLSFLIYNAYYVYYQLETKHTKMKFATYTLRWSCKIMLLCKGLCSRLVLILAWATHLMNCTLKMINLNRKKDN